MQSVKTLMLKDGMVNRHTGWGQLQFYLLLDLLHQEAEFAAVQTRMVRQETQERGQRKQYRLLDQD